MEKQNVPWSHSSERFVLFLDIMGFKERVARTDFDKMKNELSTLNERWKNRIKPLKLNGHLKDIEFSDSIIVTTDSDNQKCMNLITRAAISIMQETIKAGFAMRGAMSHGKFCFDEDRNLYFGQALVDAFLLEEMVDYYGVVVHHSAEKHVKDYLCDKNNDIYFEKTSVQIKDGKVNCYQLNWADMDTKNKYNDNRKQVLSWLENIEETVSGKPRIYIDNTRSVLEATSHNKKGKEVLL